MGAASRAVPPVCEPRGNRRVDRACAIRNQLVRTLCRDELAIVLLPQSSSFLQLNPSSPVPAPSERKMGIVLEPFLRVIYFLAKFLVSTNGVMEDVQIARAARTPGDSRRMYPDGERTDRGRADTDM